MKKIGKTLVLGLATVAMTGCSCSWLETYKSVSFNEFKAEGIRAASSEESQTWQANIRKIIAKAVTKSDKVNENQKMEVIINGEEFLPGTGTSQEDVESIVLIVAFANLGTVAQTSTDESEQGTKYYLGTYITKGFKLTESNGEMKWNKYGFPTSIVTNFTNDEEAGTGTSSVTFTYK